MAKLENPKQELFCQYYSSTEEFFGNGVESYIKAYQTENGKRITYKSAKTCAYRLLTNVDILARINELMDLFLNDQVVDKELSFVVMQKGDLSAKVAAIREYNKLKQRIVDKIEHSGSIDTTKNLTDEELDAKIREISGKLEGTTRKTAETSDGADGPKGK